MPVAILLDAHPRRRRDRRHRHAIRDITEPRRIEAEMRRKAAELVEAGRQKDEFLATLAHELRNPLAPILNAMRIIGLRGGGRSGAGADPGHGRAAGPAHEPPDR